MHGGQRGTTRQDLEFRVFDISSVRHQNACQAGAGWNSARARSCAGAAARRDVCTALRRSLERLLCYGRAQWAMERHSSIGGARVFGGRRGPPDRTHPSCTPASRYTPAAPAGWLRGRAAAPALDAGRAAEVIQHGGPRRRPASQRPRPFKRAGAGSGGFAESSADRVLLGRLGEGVVVYLVEQQGRLTIHIELLL